MCMTPKDSTYKNGLPLINAILQFHSALNHYIRNYFLYPTKAVIQLKSSTELIFYLILCTYLLTLNKTYLFTYIEVHE